jgi:hypothetical protein
LKPQTGRDLASDGGTPHTPAYVFLWGLLVGKGRGYKLPAVTRLGMSVLWCSYEGWSKDESGVNWDKETPKWKFRGGLKSIPSRGNTMLHENTAETGDSEIVGIVFCTIRVLRP